MPTQSALITGAASGLGAAFSHALAAKGYDLILVDRDRDSLRSLRTVIESRYAVPVKTVVADLSERQEVEAISKRIAASEALEILVNNAGFMLGGSFVQNDFSQLAAMIHVHVAASVLLSRAALPGMIARKKGSIVNVSSLAGLRPGLAGAIYGATKRFLIHFSLSLQAQLEGTGVRVQALCPGYTRTRFHNRSQNGIRERDSVPPRLWMSPESVVAACLDALNRPEVICIPGWKNRVIAALFRFPLLRQGFLKLLARLPAREEGKA